MIDSPPALFSLISAAVALVTLWTVGIPKVGATPSFGFQSPVCWLAVVLLLGAVFLPNLTLGTASLLGAELVLVSWYAWAIWLVTTPTYSSQYNFVGTDIVATAWYAAALGLLWAGAAVALRYREGDHPTRNETWWLALVPGCGLIRLDRTARGLLWMVLVASALLLASLDSPIAPLFLPLHGLADLPEPLPTRVPTWIFLGAAVLLAAMSVADTIRIRRRFAHP